MIEPNELAKSIAATDPIGIKLDNAVKTLFAYKPLLLGSNDDNPRYDILNTVIVYISEKHDTGNTDNSLIKMLTDFFDERLSGKEKVKKLKEDHGIPMTREIGKEVPEVCTYAEAMVLKGIKQERDNTKREKQRADAETQRADAAEARIRELEAQLAASGKKNKK